MFRIASNGDINRTRFRKPCNGDISTEQGLENLVMEIYQQNKV